MSSSRESREVVGHEVADPDGADLAVGQERLQRLVGLDGEGELAREGLVQDQQVDPVDAEFARALVEGVQRRVVAVVGDPDLRLDEDVGAIETGAADGFADLAFVQIRRGGVDVAVSGLQCRLDRCNGVVGRRLKDAETRGPVS